jgi:hypothetical protein
LVNFTKNNLATLPAYLKALFSRSDEILREDFSSAAAVDLAFRFAGNQAAALAALAYAQLILGSML